MVDQPVAKPPRCFPVNGGWSYHTLPETNMFAPENRPGPKRKRSYSNHPFSGVNSLLVSGRVSAAERKKLFGKSNNYTLLGTITHPIPKVLLKMIFLFQKVGYVRTAKAPEKLPKPNRKVVFQSYHFSGANC